MQAMMRQDTQTCGQEKMRRGGFVHLGQQPRTRAAKLRARRCSFVARYRLVARTSAHGQEAKASADGGEARDIFAPPVNTLPYFPARPRPPPPLLPWRRNIMRICADKNQGKRLVNGLSNFNPPSP